MVLIRVLNQLYCLPSWVLREAHNSPHGPEVPDLHLPRSSVEGLISARTEKAQNSDVRRVPGWQRGRQSAGGRMWVTGKNGGNGWISIVCSGKKVHWRFFFFSIIWPVDFESLYVWFLKPWIHFASSFLEGQEASFLSSLSQWLKNMRLIQELE